MNKNTKWILIIIIVILAGALVYSLAQKNSASDEGSEYNKAPLVGTNVPENANMPPGNGMTAVVPAALTDAQKAELAVGTTAHKPTELTFDVTGGSFYYTPNEIRVKQGDKVKIVFTNAGGMHNLTFDDPKIATKTIKTGETDTIEFTAGKKGTFEFYCSVGKGYHRMMGQIGVLLVE